MTTTTRERDAQVASQFFDRKDALKVMDKFSQELDWELQSDMVATGCYLQMRSEGVDPVWAKLSACRKVRIGATNKQFQKSEQAKMEGMNPIRRENILAAAKKNGIDTSGCVYVGALGGPGSRDAWVKTLDDVKSSARRQGIGISGLVDYTPPQYDPKPRQEIASDIVDELVQAKLGPGRSPSPNKLKEMREAVIQHHKRKPKAVKIRSVR